MFGAGDHWLRSPLTKWEDVADLVDWVNGTRSWPRTWIWPTFGSHLAQPRTRFSSRVSSSLGWKEGEPGGRQTPSASEVLLSGRRLLQIHPHTHPTPGPENSPQYPFSPSLRNELENDNQALMRRYLPEHAHSPRFHSHSVISGILTGQINCGGEKESLPALSPAHIACYVLGLTRSNHTHLWF